MDHSYIEAQELVERYHRGLLPPEEEERFEEHFVACPECREQLELVRGFQKGIKALAAEDAARRVVVAGLFGWLARRGRLAQWGLALAALLVTFPSSFFAPGDYRLRVEGVRPEGAASEVGGYPFRVVGRQ